MGEREFGVTGGEAGTEVVFPCLDGSFGCIDPMVVRLNDLQLAIILGEKFFDVFCRLSTKKPGSS